MPRMKSRRGWFLGLLATGVCGSGIGQAAAPVSNLLANAGFEQAAAGDRPAGWSGLWTREAGAGVLALDAAERHGGARSVRLEHRGARDWSFTPELSLAAQPGEVVELRAWVKVRGEGSVTLGAAAYGPADVVVDWIAGAVTAEAAPAWQELRTRLVGTPEVARWAPRLIGEGAATVWVDDVTVLRGGSIGDLAAGRPPATFALTNTALVVALRTADGTLAVTDRRTGRTWTQAPAGRRGTVLAATRADGELRAEWLDPALASNVTVTVRLDGALPEVLVTLEGRGGQSANVAWPPPFTGAPGERLIVPMNEGIAYPVDDPRIEPFSLVGYGGHGICMSFWGLTDGRQGQMAIIETPDDMQIRILRQGAQLAIAPVWQPQRGAFGYPRRLRYVFFADGGYVAMCKRYRAAVQAAGRLKTLAAKRQANPRVDLLVGAVNVWCWDGDAAGIVAALQARGIGRILWSAAAKPETLRALNAKPGVLTSRYDIYQDLMDPAIVREQGMWRHGDWTQEGFPADIMLDAAGRPLKGWEVKGKDGRMYPCAVLCDSRALEHARRRVPAELRTHPYGCRFIDTTTASPWRECYHPDHPLTRGASREWKMRLLAYLSDELGLVTGSETGHDAAVPFVHYFEGMLSLGPYRVPDAGRDMARTWTEVPELVARFQLGHAYRLPLWELVYHDCVVAQWYWGDYNNKLPALWDKRDLFNALYGTPPMFMFDRVGWERQADRFVRSYQAVCPVARATGYAEMTDHRDLTPDRAVQQTTFANGVTVTVNFGEAPVELPGGEPLAGGGCRVQGLPQ